MGEIRYDETAGTAAIPFKFLPDQTRYTLTIRNVRKLLLANDKGKDTYRGSLLLRLPLADTCISPTTFGVVLPPGREDYYEQRTRRFLRDKTNYVHCLVHDARPEGPPHTPTPAVLFELKIHFSSLDIDLTNDAGLIVKITAEDNQSAPPGKAATMTDLEKMMIDAGIPDAAAEIRPAPSHRPQAGDVFKLESVSAAGSSLTVVCGGSFGYRAIEPVGKCIETWLETRPTGEITEIVLDLASANHVGMWELDGYAPVMSIAKFAGRGVKKFRLVANRRDRKDLECLIRGLAAELMGFSVEERPGT